MGVIPGELETLLPERSLKGKEHLINALVNNF